MKWIPSRQVVGWIVFACVCAASGPVWAHLERAEHIQVIQEDIQRLEAVTQVSPNEPQVLSRLAGLYLQLGDLSAEGNTQRIAIHEAGARLAKQALTHDESLADAHFFYAANLGSATQLKGRMASALVVDELKFHANRAVELQSDHAPALHMLGRMLDELPWFLGGDEDAALAYLKKAVLADEHDTHARLDLAKLYVKRKNVAAATKELRNIVQRHPSEQNWSWAFRYKPEAEKILQKLEGNVQNSAESH
ncbi:tetratricopeptide repeat protein [Nitrospira sp. M1]